MRAKAAAAAGVALAALAAGFVVHGRRGAPGWRRLPGTLYAHRGLHGPGVPENSLPAFRAALFQVTSIHTSTGFTSEDLTIWPSCTWFPLVLLMISGASSGSTSGGAKCIRLLILYRAVRNEFRRIVHPNAVLPLRIGKQPIGTQTVLTVFICIFLYVGFSLFFAFLCMESGYSFVGSISYCAGCIGNTGAAFGEFGGSSCSFLSPAWKWASSFMMLVGRLEFFTILLLFTPQFWKHQ